MNALARHWAAIGAHRIGVFLAGACLGWPVSAVVWASVPIAGLLGARVGVVDGGGRRVIVTRRAAGAVNAHSGVPAMAGRR